MSKGLEALEKLYPKTTYMPYYTRNERRAFCKIIEKELKVLEILKKELMIEVKEDNGLYRLVTYQSDNHLLRKDQYDILKEAMLWD